MRGFYNHSVIICSQGSYVGMWVVAELQFRAILLLVRLSDVYPGGLIGLEDDLLYTHYH